MFGFFSNRRERRYIDHGRVDCPIGAGDIDVDNCVECCRRQEMNIREGFVRCRAGTDVQDAMHFYASLPYRRS